MTTPRLHHVQCLTAGSLHRMAYWEWGDALNPKVLICVHGLTRQGRDFDALAQAMSDEYRVVCPDVAGRGESDWLLDPNGYTVPLYVADMVTLLARLNADAVDWVGTSMGGLIGLGLAGLPHSPIRRFVINDVGPTLEASAIARIGSYLGLPMHWNSVDEAADYMGSISKGFGPHTRAQWLALTRPMLKVEGSGFRPHYDPRIGVPFRAVTPEIAAFGEAMLWKAYDAVSAPTLLLRGADSDLLTAATAQAMTQRGPHAQLVEFAGVGHAPTLMAPEQIAAVREFLLRP
ncbi:MAG: alpha/beta hydrolase [Pseudorhodobacter sp.]|nr:alpha/beta hydrolase [Rhizobacter sp.]